MGCEAMGPINKSCCSCSLVQQKYAFPLGRSIETKAKAHSTVMYLHLYWTKLKVQCDFRWSLCLFIFLGIYNCEALISSACLTALLNTFYWPVHLVHFHFYELDTHWQLQGQNNQTAAGIVSAAAEQNQMCSSPQLIELTCLALRHHMRLHKVSAVWAGCTKATTGWYKHIFHFWLYFAIFFDDAKKNNNTLAL